MPKGGHLMNQKKSMPKWSFTVPLVIVMLFLVFTGVGFAAQSPQSLYDTVWKLVNTRFVDQTKNGQDWAIWRHRYDDKIKNYDDAYQAIDTMLESLNDRYTRFLTPDEFSDEGNSIKAKLFGIGIQIGVHDNKLTVISPIDDTPAAKVGLESGDVIEEIDGTSTKGMSIKDAADHIRGPKGTPVKLLIERGHSTPKVYTVVRDEIKLKSVTEKPPIPVKSNIGYIRLSSFLSKNASSEVKKALQDESSKQGYILDLRGNPGGLLTNAIAIANFFLGHGAIISTVDRDGYKDTRSASPGIITTKPLVLLINGGSASASEILSGALRDNDRAILVGTKSFGKGLVQEINALPNGSGVNITTQTYLTPNDTFINHLGIQPDIEVHMPKLKSDQVYDPKKMGDPQLLAAENVLEDLIDGKGMKYLRTRSLLKETVMAKDNVYTDKAEAVEKTKMEHHN